jgi:hypothetical protein
MESINNEVAIGQKIKEVIESSEIKIGDLADKLGMVRQNVYRIFERTNIDTGLLIRISELLEHDFFQYYTKPVVPEMLHPGDFQATTSPEEPGTKAAYATMAAELAKTKGELELANKEIMYLKKIIDLMEERAKWLNNR